MVSVWGIIKLAQGVLDIKGSNIEIQPISFSEIQGSSAGDKGKLPDTNPFQPTPNPSNPLQTDSNGTQRENPFANTIKYPLIKIGYNNKGYLDELIKLLRNKKCMASNHDFGTTYGEEDTDHVKDFQKANGLIVDGTVGKDT